MKGLHSYTDNLKTMKDKHKAATYHRSILSYTKFSCCDSLNYQCFKNGNFSDGQIIFGYTG